jgi:hypothetical protein
MVLRPFAVVLLALSTPSAAMACTRSPLLEGAITIPQCLADADAECLPSGKAVFDAVQALEMPGVFTLGLQSSPWRMYEPSGRILTIEDVASIVRANRPEEDERVRLVGSWTSALPEGGKETLARRLSKALDGFPVDGSDGFLWLSANGALRTTRQAHSVWKSGPYSVRAGDEVMVAFVPGSLAQLEEQFAEKGMVDAVIQAGVGHDVFALCPERALAAFKRAGEMGSEVGAYNAGLILAESGDHDAAVTWLEKAATLGESKANGALAALRNASPARGER